ncbi:B3 domain-containing protein isoform X1 [Capsicum annuum]|uniref:B3 domain-containing protein Os01g0723500 isoform X1 n=1 Tax=Capsicum annuum TaxID=4072 RepID=UPI0007BEC1AF|nr:B3 domain-containing protein Os01g0723500 isoform X1 [Capsicum annuum]XP_016568699.1 B3 domain-containing protein Os01g0723500 isoform X1 [Capsicum annuum]
MCESRKPHFLVGFNPSLNYEKLKVPSKFTKHIEERASGTAVLVGPSGNSWHVDLIQQDDGLFFHNGWASFVKDHCIEAGDSLVFRDDGDLHFTVQVFDESSCEKEAAYNADCSQGATNLYNLALKKRDRGNSVLLDCIVEGVPKKMRSTQNPSECTSSQDTHELAFSKDGYTPEDAGRDYVASFLDEMENAGDALDNTVTIAVPSQAMVVFDNPVMHLESKAEVKIGSGTSEEDMWLPAQEAEKVARLFTSSFPSFTKVMKRFNISGSYTLHIPYQFATEYLPNCKVKILLHNLKGKTWTVNSIPTTRVQTSHTFCGGWLSFVRENNIDLGDICIFELVRECELRVRVLRVEREGNGYSSKAVHEGLAADYAKISGSKSRKVGANSNHCSQQVVKAMKYDKKGSNHDKGHHGNMLKNHQLHCQSKISSGDSAIRKPTSSQDKQGSFTKSCMSMKSVPEEKLAAESFVSNFPRFVRIMKKFNVSGSYTLKVPYRFSMEHLPNCRTEIVLHNLKGECWTVNSIPTVKVQTLHTFCGGWSAFVRENDIQMGDICIFELIGKYEMRVHICANGVIADQSAIVVSLTS